MAVQAPGGKGDFDALPPAARNPFKHKNNEVRERT
jgi:hypothetical protein